MTNLQKGIALVIAGAVIGFVASVVMHGSPSQNAGGVYEQTIGYFPAVGVGDKVFFYKNGTIGPGANQSAWLNNTGQPVLIDAGTTAISYTSGTATSSYLFYVSTSTSPTVADYGRPAGSYFMIDGATIATSTVPNGSLIMGTSTSAGKGGIIVQPNEYLNFDVQERYFCKANALCETATSTNRGIQTFNWTFNGVY